MRKHLKWIIPVIIIVIAGGAFGYMKFFAWNPERQKLATIDGRVITVAQFSRAIAKIPDPYKDMLKEDPKAFLEQLVLKEVLLQEAGRLGIKPDGDAKGEDAEISIVHNLLKKEVMDKVQVTKEDVESIYKEHKKELGNKPLSEVGPILENALREAKGKEKMEEYVLALKNKAKIEMNEKYLQVLTAPAPETNSAEEFKKALQSGKPVLVDFGANNCMPCRQIRPFLKEIGQEYNEKAKVLIIDVYKCKDLAAEYRVQVIPTLVFFDKSGKEVFRHVGAWDKASIAGKLKEAGTT